VLTIEHGHAQASSGRGRWWPWRRDRWLRDPRPQRHPFWTLFNALRRIGSGTFDLLAIVAVAVLVGLGVLNLDAVGGHTLASHQLATAAAGLVLLMVFWRSRARLLTILGWLSYVTAVLCLLAVLVIGVKAFGATRWLSLGSLTFQPSELAKLGLLLTMAAVLGSNRPSWQRFVFAVLLALPPIALTVLEPDLSTAAVLVALAVAMLIIGRVPLRFLLPLFGGVAVVAPLAIHLLRPYQLARVHAFVTSTSAGTPGSASTGWAVSQAHIALASGGLFGRARDPLHLVLAQYLPDRETDLALASLVEEWGLLAGVVAVVAALILVWRLALASRVPRTRHGMLVGAGLAVLIGVEAIVSLGGNLGLLPLAGVPFPVLSYGGTAVVVHMTALGMVLGARRDGARRRLWAAPRWRNPRPRLVRLGALGLTALLVLFGFYGWQLQRDQGPALAAAGQVEMTRCVALPAPRGTVTDRHGAVLASDVDADRVLAVPALLRDQPADVTRLADLTGTPATQLRSALAATPATQLSIQVADVPGPTAATITAARLPGVLLVPDPRRLYPTGPLLAPVLGFVGIATADDVQRWPNLPNGEFVGRSGIEEEYDAVLRGVDGQQCVYVDPAGKPVAMGPRRAPVPGANLRLSLDLGLQQQLTAGLVTALGAEPQARGSVAAGVAMDPHTGAVLALASLPSYDNNIYGPPIDQAGRRGAATAPGTPMLEHATESVAPPGSTFKLVVASADMVNPVIPPDKVIPTGGEFDLGGHVFHNWKTLGPMDLVQSIAWSNDVYFYQLAWALGADPLINTAHALGVGAPSGIDLPGESPGYLGTPRTVQHWYAGSTVILGIGQGYLEVTPLQDARWTAAVSTGGLVTPRLGLAAGSAGGAYTAITGPAPTALPFAAALGPVQDGMRQAVTGGTAHQLTDIPVPVGAKTGTAQDPSSVNGGLDDWMTAAAPMGDPSIVVTAMVQGPGEGATSAGPAVNATLQYYFAREAQIVATPPMEGP
jgi:cell division protein FtsI/penicillin-binding protein 2/cell division protein FtsW (lipid II flippase)